jgi:hypothetical protein
VVDSGQTGVATPSGSVAIGGWFATLPWSALALGPAGGDLLGLSASYQALFAATVRLGARGCCVMASRLDAESPDWIAELAAPVLESECDLVAPYYAPNVFGGLLNSSIVGPLTRSLYGKRLRNPMGPDVAVSARVVQKLVGADRNGTGVGGGRERTQALAAVASAALCANFDVCQVHLGSRVYPPPDWQGVSSILAQVLGPLFLDMERNAGCWQRTRGSVPVRTIGDPRPAAGDAGAGAIDVTKLIESFNLGVRDLPDIWGLILPPATLWELRKLARVPAADFDMRDELWVRIVYDFALGHRLRPISRDHLLRSLTPLYLGWVASYVREVELAGAGAAESRLERLALAYELAKPYLVSRWRWPDRFSP